MIISLLGKYWRVILDVLIVLGIVVIIFIWNPFNLFGGGLKLHQTANNVSAIKKIGQLITAEYYGETISTIDQSRLQLIYSDDVNARADLLFVQIKQELLANHAEVVIANIKEEEKVPKFFRWLRFSKKSKTKFKEALNSSEIKVGASDTLANDSLYKPVVEYYWRYKKKSNRKIKKEPIDKKDISNALWILMQEITSNMEQLTDHQFETYLNQGLPAKAEEVFTDFYYAKKDASLTNKEQKKKLSMIGRGWVKAGFDFETLDERNFILDKDRGVVHLFGVKAEILDADINPWFIPEKKIPGFQILDYNNKVNFEDAKLVKRYCVDKLRKMALDAGILEQAEQLGKESVKSFISLISGIEIKEVYFHYDRFSVVTKELLSDHFISYEESLLLERLINQQVDSIIRLDGLKENFTHNQQLIALNEQRLKSTIHHLKTCWFEEKNQYYNRLSSIIHSITADQILTDDEWDSLNTYKWPLEKVLQEPASRRHKRNLEQGIWYEDSYEVFGEFNTALDTIFQRTRYYGNIHEITVPDTTNIAAQIKSLEKMHATYLSQYSIKDSVVISFVKQKRSKENLAELRYPFSIPNEWRNLIQQGQSPIKQNTGVIDTLTLDSLSHFAFDVEWPKDTCITAPSLDVKYSKAGRLKLVVERSKNEQWQVSYFYDANDKLLPCPHSKEERILFNHMANTFIKNQPGYFTTLSHRLKTTLNPDSLQQKSKRFRETIQQLVN